jgi:hypothetical protein
MIHHERNGMAFRICFSVLDRYPFIMLGTVRPLRSNVYLLRITLLRFLVSVHAYFEYGELI